MTRSCVCGAASVIKVCMCVCVRICVWQPAASAELRIWAEPPPCSCQQRSRSQASHVNPQSSRSREESFRVTRSANKGSLNETTPPNTDVFAEKKRLEYKGDHWGKLLPKQFLLSACSLAVFTFSLFFFQDRKMRVKGGCSASQRLKPRVSFCAQNNYRVLLDRQLAEKFRFLITNQSTFVLLAAEIS